MRKVVVAVPVLLSLVTALSFFLFRSSDDDSARYERRETQLVVSSLTDAKVSLYKAGKSPADTSFISEFDGASMWLSPGNYFIKAEQGKRTLFYPIPLTGYRCGPDKDGAFLVTIRPAPTEFPPLPLRGMQEFSYIPSGNFLIGDRLNPREPHHVWLTGYFIAPFEVSNREFRRFIDASDGYRDNANWTDEGKRWKSSGESNASANLNVGDKEYERFGSPDKPVTWVNWFEANAYCIWLTRTIGGKKWLFSLPNDAEWEKAARGPDNLDYALSMFISDNETKLYNWKKNPWETVAVMGTHDTTGRFKPNRYGVFHLTGNVVEWTQSVSRPYNRERPFADDDRNHDNVQGSRTARGGSWYSAATSYLYIPYRDSFQPEHSTHDLGFRIIARALP